MPQPDIAEAGRDAGTLAGFLGEIGARYGDATAVRWHGGAYSYRDLQQRSRSIARGLLAIGLGKGSRVALLAGNTEFWLRCYFACAEIGAIVVPVSTLSSPQELAHILRHGDAHILLASRRYAGRDYGERVAEAIPSLRSARHGAAFRLREAPFLRSIWFDDAEGLPWSGSIDELIAAGEADAQLDDGLFEEIRGEIAPSDDAVIIYTSGSTRFPKAVVHSNGAVIRQAHAMEDAYLGPAGEKWICMLPMFWVGGMGIVLSIFSAGGCLVLPDGVSADAVADAIVAFGADVLHGWPHQRESIRRRLKEDGVDIEAIRGLRDERFPDGTVKLREHIPNALGMTETFGPHGMMRVGTSLEPHRYGAFAPASGGFERRVVDPETGEALADDSVGELQVRGPSLMRGYYKTEPSATFTPDGFFPTRDLVRIDADGFLFFEGRIDDMVKTRGANVSRLEVEHALRRIPAVAEAVVCGLPDPRYGQILAAIIVVAPGATPTPTEAELKTQLATLIATYKIPSHILIVAASDIPWSASGKIRVGEVRSLVERRLGTP